MDETPDPHTTDSDAPDPHATVLHALSRFAECWRGSADLAAVERFRGFLNAHPDALFRTCSVGHITASAWILHETNSAALLTHHRKLDKWLQLGGHVDGDRDPAQAALREAREESGLHGFEFLQPKGVVAGPLVPLDLDVHGIPAGGGEPAHLHYDLRYLLRANGGALRPDARETKELRFVPFGELTQLTREESVLRLHRRALQWLELGGVAQAE